MKRWETINKFKVQSEKFKVDEFIKILLKNRGIKTKKETEEFLDPMLGTVTAKNVGIDSKNLKKAIQRIQSAIKNKEEIVVFGDYDVDGICGTAILWEVLHALGAKVLPYIPHRIDEGYGLSIKGIQNVILNLFQDPNSGQARMTKMLKPHFVRLRRTSSGRQVQHDNNSGLIITVDNGIVANKAVEFAKEQGIDVIITDHHVPSKKLPDAYALIHTTKLCGAGVAWAVAQEFKVQSSKFKVDDKEDDHLELVALATIADLVPLIGTNRTFVKFGLKHLRQTKRVGLLELFKEAGLDPSRIGVYEVGHIIAPRLNAMGRLEYAMDSLRLLCTKNRERARMLAKVLGNTNRERQELTLTTVENAKFKLQNSKLQFKIQNLLFIADASYQQGIIGLVAGKLVEEFYRPAIVVSVGEKYSKASARSVNGFNIIEFIRSASELLVDAGGHPMAAGFTVETSKLSVLKKMLEEKAQELLTEEKLTRSLRVDCDLELSYINEELYSALQKLAPFGMGNPEPTFVSLAVTIENIRIVGKEGNHLKLVVSQKTISSRHSGEEERRLQNLDSGRAHSSLARMTVFDGIAFGMGERYSEFNVGDAVDIVYTIDENEWNGNKSLQLKIKDIKLRAV